MEFLKTYKTGGSLTTFKYSEEEFLNYNITMWLLAIAFGIVFSLFVSPILMVLRVVGRNDSDSWAFSAIGIVTCIYTLIDIHKGWLYSVTLRAFDIVETSNLSAITLAYICGHIWLLIFPPKKFWPSLVTIAIIVLSLFMVFKKNEIGPQMPNQMTKTELIN